MKKKQADGGGGVTVTQAAPPPPAPGAPGYVEPSPLPDGWTENVDPESGKKYYFHAATNTSQWGILSTAPAAAARANTPTTPRVGRGGGAAAAAGVERDRVSRSTSRKRREREDARLRRLAVSAASEGRGDPGAWSAALDAQQTQMQEFMKKLIEDATGSAPRPEPFLNYIETKYRALYGLA